MIRAIQVIPVILVTRVIQVIPVTREDRLANLMQPMLQSMPRGILHSKVWVKSTANQLRHPHGQTW